MSDLRSKHVSWEKMQLEHHFTKVHSNVLWNYPAGSNLEKDEVKELKMSLQRRPSFFTKPTRTANAATEASFRVGHNLTEHKKTFSDGGTPKEVLIMVAKSLFQDHNM